MTRSKVSASENEIRRSQTQTAAGYKASALQVGSPPLVGWRRDDDLPRAERPMLYGREDINRKINDLRRMVATNERSLENSPLKNGDRKP